MRLFECLILLSLAPCIVGLLLPSWRRQPWFTVMAGLAVLWSLFHWLFEGWRWQMIPTYGLVAWAGALALLRRPGGAVLGKERVCRRVGGALAALLAYAVAAALPIALPIFQLPPPTGPYAVGTLRAAITDESRRGIFSSANPSEPRRLMLQAWYPAEPMPDRSPAPYLSGGPFLLSYWSLIPTHARNEVPVSDRQARYPVILYAHCYTCLVNESTRLMEELASHGYIVVSVAHPHEEAATVYPDGRVLTGDFARMTAVRKEFPLPDFYATLRAADSLDKKLVLFRELLAKTPSIAESATVWTADTRFILDHLQTMDAKHGGPLAGKFDWEHVGALGYSLGGAVAGQLCVADPRVQACVNIDCVNFGEMIDHIPDKPLMFIASEAFRGANDPIYLQTSAPAYKVTIASTTHMNFGDFALQAPFLRLLTVPEAWASQVGIVGPVIGDIAPLRTGAVTQIYARHFFDRYLKGLADPFLDQPSADFPEADIAARRPATR